MFAVGLTLRKTGDKKPRFERLLYVTLTQLKKERKEISVPFHKTLIISLCFI